MSLSSGDSRKNPPGLMSYIKSSTFKSVHELCDVISVIVCCHADSSIMLVVESNSNEYWIPSVKTTGTMGWLGHVSMNLLHDVILIP